jgi:hypothetical protein
MVAVVAAPMVAVAEDIDSRTETEVEVVLAAATYCHNCRKTDCHSQLALHTWDRDTFAS